MEKPFTYNSIQALRAFAALLVVLFHLRIVEEKYGQGTSLLPKFIQFADAGVDLFFVISGFVMAVIVSTHMGSRLNAAQFLWRRAWRILPLYWLYTTLVVILLILTPAIVNSSYNNQSILASYLLWPQQQVPILTVGWTLIHEAYFYIVVAVAIALLRPRHFPALLFVWAIFILAMQYFQSYVSTPLINVLSSPMTLEFIAGAFIGIYARALPGYFSLFSIMIGLIVFSVGMYLPGLLGVQEHDPMQRTLVFGSASTLIVLGAVCWESAKVINIPGWLKAIGDSSFSLYLSHVFVISAAGRFWRATLANENMLHHAVFIIVAALAAIMVGLISYRLLEKPLLKLQYSFR